MAVKQEVDGVFSFLEPVMSSHPNLFEARAFKSKGKDTGEPKFSLNLHFDPASKDLGRAKSIAVAVAKAKWPDRDLKTIKFPFSNGDKLADKREERSGKDDAEFNRGTIVIAGRSKFRPELSIPDKNKGIYVFDEQNLDRAKSKFFFGAEVIAELKFVAYEGVGANPDGVTAYLQKVCATGGGTKIAGGSSSTEVFKGYVGQVSDDDPTKGMDAMADDEIPF